MSFSRRVPFTLLMVFGVGVVGVLLESWIFSHDRNYHRAFGSSLETTANGELFRLVTSLFLTAGGWRFFASVGMLAICVGMAEWRMGTWKAIVAFFGSHVLTLGIIYFVCVWPMSQFSFPSADLLVDARDTGPSAGYYGCLGAVLINAKQGWKWIIFVFVALIARLVISVLPAEIVPHLLMGNLAHVIAFPIGMALGSIVNRTPKLRFNQRTFD